MSSSSSDLFNITKNALKKYIDDGNLMSSIDNANYPAMPIIKFVSFDRRYHLRLILAGQCPNCNTSHLRNTCNYRYCKEVIYPLLKPKFNILTNVSPISTHDPKIESFVNQLGGTISYPYNPNERKAFKELEIFMLDHHPDIDTCVKMLSLKEEDAVPFQPNDVTTFNEIKKKYKFMFVMQSESKICKSDGSVISGCETICREMNELATGFSVDTSSSSDGITIVVANGRAYNMKKYFVISF